VPALVKMALSAERPQARLHALATLDGLGKLPVPTLERALSDAHPGVRRWALQLAEPRGTAAPVLIAAAVALTSDPDPKVRLQLACSLGEWSNPQASSALARLAADGASDEYLSAAVLSSLTRDSLPAVLDAVMQGTGVEPTAAQGKLVESLLTVAVKMDSRQALSGTLSELLARHAKRPSPWQFAAAGAVAEAMARGNRPLDAHFDKAGVAAWQELERGARQAVADATLEPSLRAAATRLLGRDEPERTADLDRLRELLVPQSPAEVQSAVVARLAGEAEPEVAQWLLAGWRGHTPALRSQILAVVASRPAWMEALVGKLESRDVLPAEIDAPLRQRLAATKDAALRSRLEKLFALASTADRQQALAAFQPALQLTGDRTRGAAVHQKRCATCHRLEEKGFEVGPNLVSLSNKSPAALLTAMLDPSSAVDAKYVDYVATTLDGRTFNGILATETGANLVLLAAEGKRQVILRTELESLQSTGKSLMPDGLEKDLSLQEMADLIEYLAKAGTPASK
jgi:putative heme-binding domain-containing protein